MVRRGEKTFHTDVQRLALFHQTVVEHGTGQRNVNRNNGINLQFFVKRCQRQAFGVHQEHAPTGRRFGNGHGIGGQVGGVPLVFIHQIDVGDDHRTTGNKGNALVAFSPSGVDQSLAVAHLPNPRVPGVQPFKPQSAGRHVPDGFRGRSQLRHGTVGQSQQRRAVVNNVDQRYLKDFKEACGRVERRTIFSQRCHVFARHPLEVKGRGDCQGRCPLINGPHRSGILGGHDVVHDLLNALSQSTKFAFVQRVIKRQRNLVQFTVHAQDGLGGQKIGEDGRRASASHGTLPFVGYHSEDGHIGCRPYTLPVTGHEGPDLQHVALPDLERFCGNAVQHNRRRLRPSIDGDQIRIPEIA